MGKQGAVSRRSFLKISGGVSLGAALSALASALPVFDKTGPLRVEPARAAEDLTLGGLQPSEKIGGVDLYNLPFGYAVNHGQYIKVAETPDCHMLNHSPDFGVFRNEPDPNGTDETKKFGKFISDEQHGNYAVTHTGDGVTTTNSRGRITEEQSYATFEWKNIGILCNLDSFEEDDYAIDIQLKVIPLKKSDDLYFFSNPLTHKPEDPGVPNRESYTWVSFNNRGGISGNAGVRVWRLEYQFFKAGTSEPADMAGLWCTKAYMQPGTGFEYRNKDNAGFPLGNVAISNDCPPDEFYDERSITPHLDGSFLFDNSSEGTVKLSGMIYRTNKKGMMCDYLNRSSIGRQHSLMRYHLADGTHGGGPYVTHYDENDIPGTIFCSDWADGADTTYDEHSGYWAGADTRYRNGIRYPDTLWWRSASFQAGSNANTQQGKFVVINPMESEYAWNEGNPASRYDPRGEERGYVQPGRNWNATMGPQSTSGLVYWEFGDVCFWNSNWSPDIQNNAYNQKILDMFVKSYSDAGEEGQEARKVLYSMWGREYDGGNDGVSMWWSPLGIIQRRPKKRAVLTGPGVSSEGVTGAGYDYTLDGQDGTVQAGEEYAYEVTQQVPELGTTEIHDSAVWTSLEFRDDMGPWLTIIPEKCKVYAPSGADITDTAGEFHFDEALHKVQYVFNDEYMGDPVNDDPRALQANTDDTKGMVYNGGRYRFWVTVRVRPDAPKTEIHNIAVVEASKNGGSKTNEVVVPVDVPKLSIVKNVV